MGSKRFKLGLFCCFRRRVKGGVIISVSLRYCNKRAFIAHATALCCQIERADFLFDLLVCGGLISNDIVALVFGLSLLAQVVVCVSLRRFFSEILRLSSPSLLLR